MNTVWPWQYLSEHGGKNGHGEVVAGPGFELGRPGAIIPFWRALKLWGGTMVEVEGAGARAAGLEPAVLLEECPRTRQTRRRCHPHVPALVMITPRIRQCVRNDNGSDDERSRVIA